MMKNYFWMLLMLPLLAFAGVSCDTGIDEPNKDGNDDENPSNKYEFPALREVALAAGESVTFSADCPYPFSVSIPNDKLPYFYIEDEDGQTRQSVSCAAGKHDIEIYARKSAVDYDNDIECLVSMTVGERTSDVVKITVPHLTRDFRLLHPTYDYMNDAWLSDTFMELNPVQPLEFVFNRSNDRYECPIRVLCDFEWGFQTDIDWIEPSSLTDATSDSNSRMLLLVGDKLNLDGMRGELTFTAVTSSTASSPVVTYTVEVPSSHNICYAYFGSAYIGTVASLMFDAAGNYNDANSVLDHATGKIVGTQNAQIVVAGTAADGESYEVSPAYASVSVAAGSLPIQVRSFTFDMAANTGYNRTAVLLVFNGEVPTDLLNDAGDGVNEKYEANVVAQVNQLGDKGRADGGMLNIVNTTLFGIKISEAEALAKGLKFDRLTDGETADAIRAVTGIENLEIWRLTYKSDVYMSEIGPLPLGMFGSFYFTGYENIDIDWNIDTGVIDNIHRAIGIEAPLSVESAQYSETTPKSYYVTVKPRNDTASEECVMTVHASGTSAPIVALHIVFDPNAAF